MFLSIEIQLAGHEDPLCIFSVEFGVLKKHFSWSCPKHSHNLVLQASKPTAGMFAWFSFTYLSGEFTKSLQNGHHGHEFIIYIYNVTVLEIVKFYI